MVRPYELWFQNTSFLSEHAAVCLLSVKLLFANTTEYERSNDVTVTSYYFVNKSYLFCGKKFIVWIFARLTMGKISASDEIRIQSSDFARTWFSIQKNRFKISG